MCSIIIVWITHVLIKQYFSSSKMQNQQDAACKPKQSYEIYPTVIFMIAVPWNTWAVLYWHVFIYSFSYLFSWGSRWR